MTPDDIIIAARAAVGTPFKHQGRQIGTGLDCAGLLVHVARSLNVEPLDRSGYARMPSNGQIESALDEHVYAGILVRVPANALQRGDLVLMRFERENASRHLGIVGDDTLIHAWAVVRRVCEHTLDDAWRRRIVCGYRFAGIEHGL